MRLLVPSKVAVFIDWPNLITSSTEDNKKRVRLWGSVDERKLVACIRKEAAPLFSNVLFVNAYVPIPAERNHNAPQISVLQQLSMLAMAKAGITAVYDREASGVDIDELLKSDLEKTLKEYENNSLRTVLVSGDGDYLETLARHIKDKHSLIVFSWRGSLNRSYEKAAKKIVYLDEHASELLSSGYSFRDGIIIRDDRSPKSTQKRPSES